MNPLIAQSFTAAHGITVLSVNLNKVALLRNTRTLGVPSVTRAATVALDAGAGGITVHPRPDGRHVRSHDVHELVELMKRYPHAEFNIEGNPFHQLMDFIRAVKPSQCTFVPDETGAFTSDHGWDLQRDGARVKSFINEAKALGVRVSLFMDAVPANMAQAKLLGADRVELYTEEYARAFGTTQQAAVLARYAATAQAALACGLQVNAGHDLNQANLTAFLRAVPGVQEVSIGHALIAEAIEDGLAPTVRNYLAAIQKAFA
jgi:pyridoxine 5-phosphate synthase